MNYNRLFYAFRIAFLSLPLATVLNTIFTFGVNDKNEEAALSTPPNEPDKIQQELCAAVAVNNFKGIKNLMRRGIDRSQPLTQLNCIQLGAPFDCIGKTVWHAAQIRGKDTLLAQLTQLRMWEQHTGEIKKRCLSYVDCNECPLCAKKITSDGTTYDPTEWHICRTCLLLLCNNCHTTKMMSKCSHSLLKNSHHGALSSPKNPSAHEPSTQHQTPCAATAHPTKAPLTPESLLANLRPLS